MTEFDPEQTLFGIYIHWPYCLKICPYCDFNVYAAKSRNTDQLVEALIADLTSQRTLTGPRQVTSVYFGGGTPSLIAPTDIETILKAISNLFDLAPKLEVTLEANPENVSPNALRDWKAVGINRLSLGIQSFDDEALSFLGRAHSSKEAKNAVGLALQCFDNVSIDLIYARPGQATSDWLSELEEALSLGAPHLSLYELTIKPKTAFANQVRRQKFLPMNDDDQADLYLETLALTDELGLPAYEVSNHAKSQNDWSRHNLTYWLGGEWLGIGPGAEGRVWTHDTRYQTRAITKPEDYISAVLKTTSQFETYQALSPHEIADETLIMGLRSKLGINVIKLHEHTGFSVNPDKLSQFIQSGHVREHNNRVALTYEGWLLADYITRELASS